MRKTIYTREYSVMLRMLREARQSAGMTQEELADAIGETQSFVSKVERGERRLDLIETREVCAAFGYRFPRFVVALEQRLTEEVNRNR